MVGGVCIPLPRANVDAGLRDSKLRQDHIAYLAALDQHNSSNKTEKTVLDNFNQRIRRKYQTDQTYVPFERAVLSKMEIPTAGIIRSQNKQVIDHV